MTLSYLNVLLKQRSEMHFEKLQLQGIGSAIGFQHIYFKPEIRRANSVPSPRLWVVELGIVALVRRMGVWRY
jgi:hypothetical protein